MKTTTILLLATVALSTATGALASDKTKDSKAAAPASKQKAKANQDQTPQKESTTLTGSYIKRDVRRNGVITDGPAQVIVLDNQAIRNSGAADLNELLIRRGLRR